MGQFISIYHYTQMDLYFSRGLPSGKLTELWKMDENGPVSSLIYPLKMEIFNSYVKLLEGKSHYIIP